MKFTLELSNRFIEFNSPKVETYKKLGFCVSLITHEQQKFIYGKFLNGLYISGTPEIELTTINDIVKLQENVSCELIFKNKNTITIFNGYQRIGKLEW